MNIHSVKTTCPYCGVGCGVLATPAGDGVVTIAGDAQHPANFGRLCSKGAALGETVDLDERLLYPEIHGQRVDWDTALDTVARTFAATIAAHGPDAVAFYVSGQLLTEDYYVANKLIKGYLGTANIDTNSRLCMASSVAGHKRAFGSDTVPGNYEDLESADLVVLVGSNTAWCHPVIYQRLVQAKKSDPERKIVVIDPRRTASCDSADLHLPLAPGTDVALFNGLLVYLAEQGYRHDFFINACTEGVEAALASARADTPTLATVAALCGLASEEVERFYRWFARTEKTVTVYSQGVNQSSCGTDKVNAIINCHLLTGRIGRPGMGPFSITGQPNAMGGREVGGLANQLAAHLDIDNAAHRALVQDFWQAPTMAPRAGLKAVDMFEAVADGRIKAIWIMATNPVVSLPDADRVKDALQRCAFVVVSDCTRATDTVDLAHVRLPAAAWGEKNGTVTNSERRISRQRAFLPLPGAAQPDWWIISQVARRMGYDNAFDYDSPAAIFREHARLSAQDNHGTRDFDLGGLADLSNMEYENFVPVQWPVRNAPSPAGTARFFGDGRFYTPSGKARFIALSPRAPRHAPTDEYPLILNTGRVRDHWHTMTRTGKTPRLSAHLGEPYAEIHPEDAAPNGVADGGLANLITPWGMMLARVRYTPTQRRGSVFVPMHWNAQFAAQGRVDALVNPVCDPYSGQPEAKHTPLRLTPYLAAWHGFLLSRRRVAWPDLAYWVRIPGIAHTRYELAHDTWPDDWSAWARGRLGNTDGKAEWIEFLDRGTGHYRAARLLDGRLESCFFAARAPTLPGRDWVAALFARESLDIAERNYLLSGRPGRSQPDAGPIVCACFKVGLHTLTSAIREQRLLTVEAIGTALQAGTNCGSCVPELRALLNSP